MIFDTVTNYYEVLVSKYLTEEPEPHVQFANEDLLKDIACLALNMLPARYIRHGMDMSFFLSDEEREIMLANVRQAIDKAIKIAKENPR